MVRQITVSQDSALVWQELLIYYIQPASINTTHKYRQGYMFVLKFFNKRFHIILQLVANAMKILISVELGR